MTAKNNEPLVYAQCGVRIRSEVDLPLSTVAADDWDVDVRWGEDLHDSGAVPPGAVIATSDVGDTRWYTATSTGYDYRLRFHNCGEFVISADLSEVRVRPDRSGRADLLPVLLAGTVSAFLLALRGLTVLHASAVAVDGATLAFVGQSGRGKSTLAALMCFDGAELVTDDVLSVDAGPPVTCIGGASELRLRAAAGTIARGRPDVATRATVDQRLALAFKQAPVEPRSLGGIVIPAPSRLVSDVGIRRIPPSKALFALLSFPRVHGWRHPDVHQRDFTTLSQLVNQVPVYDVTIPWGPPFSSSIARVLATLVACPVEVVAEAPTG